MLLDRVYVPDATSKEKSARCSAASAAREDADMSGGRSEANPRCPGHGKEAAASVLSDAVVMLVGGVTGVALGDGEGAVDDLGAAFLLAAAARAAGKALH